VQSHSEATALGTKRQTKPWYFDGISRCFYSLQVKNLPHKKNTSILPNPINMDSMHGKIHAWDRPTPKQNNTVKHFSTY